MDGLKNYREKIKSIEILIDKMESGELSIHELVELETLTRDLHERSIILKYKAFEGVGTKREELETKSDPVAELIDEVDTEHQDLEAETDSIKKEEPEETPVMDFSMFDEPVASEEKPEVKAPHQITLTQSDLIEEETKKTEPIIEKEPESEPVTEEPIVVVKEKGSSFLDRLSILDNSISSQFAERKIDTLSGAFGINERLLYINELFDGSGEAFSDAVKLLDTQSDLDAASDKVEELAFKNSWNPEEEVVLEFLAIIKRRYA